MVRACEVGPSPAAGRLGIEAATGTYSHQDANVKRNSHQYANVADQTLRQNSKMEFGVATWVVVAAVGAAALIYLFGGRSAEKSARTPPRGSLGELIAQAKALPMQSGFVDDLVRVYRKTGALSPKQVAALREIVDRVAIERTARPFRVPLGHQIDVEGDIIAVDYQGKGKARQGRYVIGTDRGVVIYAGPAVLVGRFGRVRFKATVVAHEDSEGGHCDTVVDGLRDIVIVKKPGQGLRDLKSDNGQSL